MLCTAAKLANISVYEHAQLSEEFRGMGTTLVAALVRRPARGDREHRRQPGLPSSARTACAASPWITLVVELMVQRGELTHEQAKNHPSKNLITRAVGTEKQRRRRRVLPHGGAGATACCCCSDGLSNQMADQEILFEVVHGARSGRARCQRLLDIAKSRGAPDNVTSVLIAL